MDTKPDSRLVAIAEKIVALQRFYRLTNFQTNRSQTHLVKDLSPEDLAIVAQLVTKALEVPR